jgi:hypothetical protein
VSNRITDGKIHTKDFGDVPVRAADGGIEMMMTDSQIKKVQTLLASKK